jgi:hypothetical protein
MTHDPLVKVVGSKKFLENPGMIFDFTRAVDIVVDNNDITPTMLSPWTEKLVNPSTTQCKRMKKKPWKEAQAELGFRLSKTKLAVLVVSELGYEYVYTGQTYLAQLLVNAEDDEQQHQLEAGGPSSSKKMKLSYTTTTTTMPAWSLVWLSHTVNGYMRLANQNGQSMNKPEKWVYEYTHPAVSCSYEETLKLRDRLYDKVVLVSSVAHDVRRWVRECVRLVKVPHRDNIIVYEVTPKGK